MGLLEFFKKGEALIGLDIGSSGVKLAELDLAHAKPRLVNLGYAPFGVDIFSGNSISKTETVAEQITGLVEGNAISDKRVVVGLPGPSVFTKRIKMPRVRASEMRDNVLLEAGNFIPHNLDAVKLDYHILGVTANNQLEVLVAAVKNEILDSFTDCLALAGLETAVVDVDLFALQNVFELAMAPVVDKTVALVNIGARYSGINICKGGETLFTGDVPVGGKIFTDALVEVLSVPFAEAESLKKNLNKPQAHNTDSVQGILDDSVQDIIERNVEYVCGELNRQISFFWNASGADENIQHIIMSGGGIQIPGLKQELEQKTGVSCVELDPFAAIEVTSSVDAALVKELGPSMGVALGLGMRQPGDRVLPEDF